MLRIEPRLAFIYGVLLANRVLIFRFQLLAVYVLLKRFSIEMAPDLLFFNHGITLLNNEVFGGNLELSFLA
jgi:hypothetical protein